MRTINKARPGTVKKPSKGKFFLLLAASTIFFGCEGFDSITAIFGIFPLSPAVMLFIGLGFSLVSIFVFYGLELFELSKQFGIKLKNSPQIVNEYFALLKEIKKTYLSIDEKFHRADEEKLLKYQAKLNEFIPQFAQLNEVSVRIKAALDNPKLTIARKVMEGVVGLTAFSLGYFAGQTLAFYLATLFVTSISIAAWPIVLVSLIVAACSLYRYWCVDRPEIDHAVSRWMGLDKEKIESICQPEYLDAVRKDIELLNEKIDSCLAKLVQIKSLSVQPNPDVAESNTPRTRSRRLEDEICYVSSSPDSFFTIVQEAPQTLLVDSPSPM